MAIISVSLADNERANAFGLLSEHEAFVSCHLGPVTLHCSPAQAREAAAALVHAADEADALTDAARECREAVSATSEVR